MTSSGIRFSILYIPNNGYLHRDYFSYFTSATTNDIANLMVQNNARLTSLRGWSNGGTTLYAGLLIGNTGTDYSSTTLWGVSATDQHLFDYQTLYSRRLISLQHNPDGSGWVFVMVDSEDEGL